MSDLPSGVGRDMSRRYGGLGAGGAVTVEEGVGEEEQEVDDSEDQVGDDGQPCTAGIGPVSDKPFDQQNNGETARD